MDPTLDLKETRDKSREELDSFLGNQDGVSGKMNEKLGENNVGEDGKPRSMSSTNADYQPTIDHIGKASTITGTGNFNFQNKVFIFFGTILSLSLLVPVTSYIMLFDLKQIIGGFNEVYAEFTFTSIFVVAFISFLIVILTEFLFLGQFNKKNKKTRKLEKSVLYFLLFIQFGSHAYFAYLITGIKNTEQKEKIMVSASSTEGILSKGLTTSTNNIDVQMKNLQSDYDKLSKRLTRENKQAEHYSTEWEKLNFLKKPSHQQAKQRRNFYTMQKKSEEQADKLDKKKEVIQERIDKLSDKQIKLTNKLSIISSGLDKSLDESGFWRIIYIILLLMLFEGLSHINWLAYYRIIKNAPDDLQEDYREMSFVLNWGTTFANKTKEAIAVMAGQQIKMADEQLNNVKLTSKAFEYQNAGASVVTIEATRANVAAQQATTSAIRQTTHATLYLAKSINNVGFSKDGEIQKLSYEPNEKIAEQKTTLPPKMLVQSLNHISSEFGVTPPSISLRVGGTSGEFDILENLIIVGENEPEKLSVLAHEFTHFLGYMTHSKEFKEMEQTVFKGLDQWYKKWSNQ
jgi:hypothetical protein